MRPASLVVLCLNRRVQALLQVLLRLCSGTSSLPGAQSLTCKPSSASAIVPKLVSSETLIKDAIEASSDIGDGDLEDEAEPSFLPVFSPERVFAPHRHPKCRACYVPDHSSQRHHHPMLIIIQATPLFRQ